MFLSYHDTGFAAAARADWRGEWDKTVAAAEKEGLESDSDVRLWLFAIYDAFLF